MSEPVIAAAEAAAAPIVQAVAKALTPEADQLLRELESVASGEFTRLDNAAHFVLPAAEHASLEAITTAQTHLAALLDHLHSTLHMDPSTSGVDPTPAAPAPPPTPS